MIVPLALVVLGVGAFVLFRGGGDGGGLIDVGGGDEPAPELTFKVTQTVAEPITRTSATELQATAREVADQVGVTMDDLYTTAFLDPEAWDDYGPVWELFDPNARDTAERSEAVLTLGPTASDTYERVTSPTGKVSVKVLMDRNDQPATAVAIVDFTAEAEGKDGTNTEIVSQGQYFLRRSGSAWTIYSFSVARDDQLVVPVPAPSGSPSGSSA